MTTRLIACLIALSLLTGGALYLHHRWFDAGAASRQGEIDTANASIRSLSGALRTQNDAVVSLKASADSLVDSFNTAAAAVTALDVARTKADARFDHRLQSAAATPECATLKALICQAVYPY